MRPFQYKKNIPTLGNCGADISQVQRKEENKKLSHTVSCLFEGEPRMFLPSG